MVTAHTKGGEVGMIQIGMEMPTKCSECRMRTDYDYCSAMPKNYCGNTEDEGRPDWCPLHEVPDNGGWISVKDRLPDEQKTYLVFRKEPYGMITIAWYSGPENGWLALDGGFYADGVLTHYMPLPEAPKEG